MHDAGIDWFNQLPPAQAVTDLLTCCHSRRWATELAATRPYPDFATLAHTADTRCAQLSWPEVLEALAAHPRIGDRASGDDRAARWSRAEQADTAHTAATTQTALITGNQEYEQRFGHVFLTCATGRTSDDMLAELQQRLGNDPADEQQETHRQLRLILRLRLEKLLASAP